MRRKRTGAGVREALERADRAFAARYGPRVQAETHAKLLCRAEALAAGLPVIVQHGYVVDLLPPCSGPFVVEPDGTIVDVVPVFVDPDVWPPTVAGYRRSDGSLVAGRSAEVEAG